MKHLLACLLTSALLVPSAASALPPRNPSPGDEATPAPAWFFKTAADAKCPSSDPVVSLDLPAMRYYPSTDPAYGRKTAFACASVARNHGLALPPAPPNQLAGSPVLFPITATRGLEPLNDGSGGQMQTNVSIDADGVLTAQTTTHEMTVLHGFHGMVTVVLADESGPPTLTDMLWVSEEKSFGVDGSAFGGKTDRVDPWGATVPKDKLLRARRIGIIHRSEFAGLQGPSGGGMLAGAARVGAAFFHIDLQPLRLKP